MGLLEKEYFSMIIEKPYQMILKFSTLKVDITEKKRGGERETERSRKGRDDTLSFWFYHNGTKSLIILIKIGNIVNRNLTDNEIMSSFWTKFPYDE